MKKIKIIESEYVSFSELGHLANKNNKSSSEVCLEYNIEESQWYLNYYYYKNKKRNSRKILLFFKK